MVRGLCYGLPTTQGIPITTTYHAVAPHVVSLVLIRDDNGFQKLVYYMSKSLHEIEVRYLSLEKAILAVVHAT